MLRSSLRACGAYLIFLLFPLFALAQRQSFSVGTASAAVGEESTGYLEVPAGVDAATEIPVIVINGAKPGPVLALISGAHGTEYAEADAVVTSGYKWLGGHVCHWALARCYFSCC